MYILKWLVVVASSPFWFPVVMFFVGFCLLFLGSVLIVSLLISLFVVLWVMKVFYVTYTGLIAARQEVLKEIGNGLNGIPWWRLIRLIVNRHLNKIKDLSQYDDYKFGEQEKDIDE